MFKHKQKGTVFSTVNWLSRGGTSLFVANGTHLEQFYCGRRPILSKVWNPISLIRKYLFRVKQQIRISSRLTRFGCLRNANALQSKSSFVSSPLSFIFFGVVFPFPLLSSSLLLYFILGRLVEIASYQWATMCFP